MESPVCAWSSGEPGLGPGDVPSSGPDERVELAVAELSRCRNFRNSGTTNKAARKVRAAIINAHIAIFSPRVQPSGRADPLRFSGGRAAEYSGLAGIGVRTPADPAAGAAG